MKPDIEKLTELKDDLHNYLISTNMLNESSWLDSVDKWIYVTYNGKKIDTVQTENLSNEVNWQKCNIYFNFNGIHYWILFPWHEKGINNERNKNQVVKNVNKFLDGKALQVWRQYSNKTNMKIIYVFKIVDTFKQRKDNMFVCSYDSLTNLFRAYVEKIQKNN